MPQFLLLLSFFCCFGASAQQMTSRTVMKEQQTIIGVLSGHEEWSQQRRIVNRSSSANRELSSIYLSELIADLGLTAEVHEYEMPNLNPLIDLLYSPFQGQNVYSVLPATIESEEYVLLGAHYDSERNCPGAIDNATGVALIYSVLKALTAVEHRTKNVMVVFFDQEEEDLVGSQAFARFCQEKAYKLHSVHTFDTMGWDRDQDRAVELELPTPALEALYRQAAERLSIPLHVTRVNSTDHHSFRQKGYAAIGLTDEFVNGDYAPLKDTPDDKYETVNFEYLASCTHLVYEVVKTILHGK